MLSRRAFLSSLLAYTLAPSFAFAEGNVGHLPVMMFHRVKDKPRYPEEISPQELYKVFTTLWDKGFYPINVTDIIEGKLESFIPKGGKPICITADDGFPCILYDKKGENSKSFVQILADSLKGRDREPRASFFLTPVGKKYLGGKKPLLQILEESKKAYPSIEFGYHSMQHKLMRDMTKEQVYKVLQEQVQHFQSLGVDKEIHRIFAYPYAIAPTADTDAIFKEFHFYAAVTAYPGIGEGRNTSPRCPFDGNLQCNPYHIPRVNIGSFVYQMGFKKPSLAIDPLDDLKKDVFDSSLPLYTVG